MLLSRPPRPSLRHFVRIVWAIDGLGSRRPAGVTREHVLPTGSMHLVFRLAGGPLRLFDAAEDREGRLIGEAVVGGPRSGYYIRDVSSPGASVGVMLRPGAAELLFGAAADELAHRHTRLDDLWGRGAQRAHERILEAGDAERRLAVLEAILAERLPPVRGLHPAIAQALERLEELHRVGTVVRESGYSHRHFIALFRRAVGLTPKAYARVRRFQHALHRNASGEPSSLAAIAAATHYSDQAHFTRDFLEFAGVTPGGYRRLAPTLPSHVPRPVSLGRRHDRPVNFLQDAEAAPALD